MDYQAEVYKKAVNIAAKVMQAAGLCRYDTPLKCRKLCICPEVCESCIEKWLIDKAKKEVLNDKRSCGKG